MRQFVAAMLAVAAVPVAVMDRPGRTVVTAAADLPSGHVVSAGDLTTLDLRRDAVPDGVVVDPATVVGGRLSGAIRRGEVLTDAALTRLHRSDAPPGSRVVPVSAADPAVATLVSPGDLVDVVVPGSAQSPGTLPPGTGLAPHPATPAAVEVIAAGAVVVEVTAADRTRPGSGRTVLVRLPADVAARVAARAVDAPVALTIHG